MPPFTHRPKFNSIIKVFLVGRSLLWEWWYPQRRQLFHWLYPGD